ncbi:MAG: S41 family peptidase, partial [Prevotella sp.]|nr:S41 family peptidase [Prevotella sp.]
MRKILTYALLTLAFLPATAQENGGDDHNFEVAKNLDVFATIYKHLDLMYVDTLDANEVIGTGIKAMLRSLDPYTEYYPQEKMEDVTQMRTGTYAGVGAVIRKNLQTGRVMVSEPYEGMPAAEAGLRRGDVLLAIDDENLTGKEVSYVSSRLRGDAGTSFIVTVERPGVKKPLKLKVTRRAIQTPVIPHYGMQTDDIGYLNLNQFTQNCSRDVRRALLEMKREGMQKLILDLRNNGGGSEQEAVNIVNMFVPKGKLIVSNRGKLKQANHDYLTTVEPIDSVMPVVVLVNGESASASEITAGALQDLDRAVILGTRTYGKGLVQMTMDLPYNGILKLTTNKYYIPSGRCIQAINYRHSQGGYVEHVSDSLTKVFHTAGGREVRDGGGILPDVVVTPDSMTNIVGYLMYGDSAEVVHNYIMDYVSAHPTIAPARDFKLTDADFEDFKQRVLKSKFNYDRSTENY